MKLLCITLALSLSAFGQTVTGGLTAKGVVNLTAATSTAPIKSGTSLPGTCGVGQLYDKTDATSTAVLYACTATNTWTQQSGFATTNQNIRTIGASFGSFESGATALSGSKTVCAKARFAGTIQAVDIFSDVSGSATIDVLTKASSWTGTASAASITAAAIPTLSSAATYTDSTLTGWTTAVTAGTNVCFALTSPTTVAGVAISLKVAATN